MSAVFPNFGPRNITSEPLRTELQIRSALMRVRTAMPVKVLAVHPGTGNPPSIGTVDVQPLVQSVDASGVNWNLVPNGGAVYGVPFSRIQAGSTAIVVDPAVNDIGLATACDRDISSVLASANYAVANDMPVTPGGGPGSRRKHNLSDFVYLFSIISAAEIAQYILANASGITLLSPNTVTIQGAQINLVGPVSQTNGDVTMQTKLTVPNVDATTDVMVPNGSVNGHVHSEVQTGLDSTGPMTG